MLQGTSNYSIYLKKIIMFQTYCKFSGVPVRLVKSNNPFKSPSGSLPVMKHKQATETKLQNIFTYFKHQKWGSDLNLTPKELADLTAFSSMIDERLRPAFLHTWWVDDTTYRDVTRPWFAKAIPFPYNFFIPWKTQRSASFYVYCSFENTACTEDEVHALIYKEAKECLNQLSYYLGEKEFFFGSEPTSLDALVFSYVGPLIKAPLPANQLTNHLKGCENLFALCNRILNRYLRPSAEEMEKLRKKAEEEKLKATDELEFPHQKRDIILATVFSLIGMVAFAFWCGFIVIDIQDDDEDDFYDTTTAKYDPDDIDGEGEEDDDQDEFYSS